MRFIDVQQALVNLFKLSERSTRGDLLQGISPMMQCEATHILTLLLLQGTNLHRIPGQMQQTQKDSKLAAAIRLDALEAHYSALDGVDGFKLTISWLCYTTVKLRFL